MVLSSLHSNMFLLIPNAARYASQLGYAFTFQYVSINTLLRFSGILRSNIFTFQYVSINTERKINAILFIKILYIPICFY